MKHLSIQLLLFTLHFASAFSQPISVTDLTCEYEKTPLGIDVLRPRLSWKLLSGGRNVKQTAYEIRVGRDAATVWEGKNLVWQTGKILSDQSVFLAYGGPALESKQRCSWQVRVWDNTGNASAWSEAQSWEMGLLQPADWKAEWIEPGLPGDSVGQPAPMLRRLFDLQKPIASARLYISSHGLYEAHLNGARVGDQCLTPGWTSYNKRLQYQTYDVTSLLKTGSNAAGVMLSDGWYRGSLAWENNRNIYGKDLGLLFQLEIRFTDGTTQSVLSDGNWTCSTGPIRKAQIYYGEAYDARLEKAEWTQAGYDDRTWAHAGVTGGSKAGLVASIGPPVRRHETFSPARIFRSPKGELIADFGQNLVGWINFRVQGKAGDEVVIHHAEVLDKQGDFYTDNLRAAKQEVRYTLKGGSEETYEPRFSYFGFRYIAVDGYPGELTPDKISATALYADMQQTGEFSCSNPLLNQLHHNIQWSQKGNFLGVPTDCPQRDERCGWTGDAQVFSRTATFNMNAASFLDRWLKDLAADQNEDGSVPHVIPNVLPKDAAGSAGWADVATIVPWNLYLVYGDRRILEQQYESMKAWVGYMESKSKGALWNTGSHFGDWLFYRPFDDNDGRSAVTDKYLIAQAFFACSTQLVINAAAALGKADDVQRYTVLLRKVKDAFLREYFTPGGRLVSGTQTAYVLALNFDLLPEEMRAEAAAKLAQNVHDYQDHLTTGFLGTPYVCQVLTRFGYADLAYKLLLQTDYPSWLYPVKMGATTIWERWDGIKPDSTFQNPGMNSFNHYAYGAVGHWMYSVMCGLSETTPGYKNMQIAPQPGGDLREAGVTFESLYGRIVSHWRKEHGRFVLDVTVPPNTEAQIVLPHSSDSMVEEHGVDIFGLTSPVKSPSRGKKDVTCIVGSGRYHFEYIWK